MFPVAVTSTPSTSARTLLSLMSCMLPEISAINFSRVKPEAFRLGTLAEKFIAGFELLPETLRVPVKLPFMSTPEAEANGARFRFVNLKLKSRGFLPETEAEPEPVILPEPA